MAIGVKADIDYAFRAIQSAKRLSINSCLYMSDISGFRYGV